ncbi:MULTISPECIES: hypothetical protein [unclassified Kitasatospora]|uniref:hypothetical protein n=1 Tax=unclassified Kitasatospora TaxID=2633591 RepID=UPI00070C10C6|nr:MULTISPECIES: hypothetical protein [unclassified Kitasatospora]KQV20931.1 hypothetical protein ASC99_20725 [Kitasatospora sp. Root107]KRB60415.1 hypothetical protein ASE03_12455 [Kitasatospora sp. Root187]
MTDIHEEDVQRLTDLANALAGIRRDLRHTAKRPAGKIPDLLAQNITALADYVATASRLRADLSQRPGPGVANVGVDWGPTFAATRSSPVLHKLTELLDLACDLANQVRPRTKTRSHFYAPGLDQRVARQFAEADDMLTHTISTIRQFRTGLGQVRKRELDREQQALADPDGLAARMLAARAKARSQPLVIVPWGFEQAAAATASAASRRSGTSRLVSRTPATDPAPAAGRR